MNGGDDGRVGGGGSDGGAGDEDALGPRGGEEDMAGRAATVRTRMSQAMAWWARKRR